MKQHKNIIWRNAHGQLTSTILYVLEADIASMTFNVRCPSEEWNYWVPFGIDYHADKPQYEGHEVIPCSHRPAGLCYADGSSLAAEELWDKFVVDLDEEVIWNCLKEWMTQRFPTAV